MRERVGGGCNELNDHLTKVHFSVIAPCEVGERVFVGGSSWSLGAFDPTRAVELFTTPQTFPLWTTLKPVLLATNKTTAYKYIVRSIDAEDYREVFTWETSHGLSRVLTPLGDEIRIQDTFSKGSWEKHSLHGIEEVDQSAQHPSHSHSKEGDSDLERDVPSHIIHDDDICERVVSVEGGHQFESASATTQAFLFDENFEKKNADKILFLISFHLPVRIYWNPVQESTEEGYWSVDWDQDNIVGKTEESISDSMDVVWIGAISRLYNSNKTFYALTPARQSEIKEVIEAQLKCRVIILPEDLYKKYYIQFCKQRLRNVFHNVLEHAAFSDQFLRTPDVYRAALDVMQIFANLIVQEASVWENAGKREVIAWAHDYHLVLLPQVLKATWRKLHGSNTNLVSLKKPSLGLKVILFTHIPFPTPEAFRTLSFHTDILIGCLAADVIGFHTFVHARYFLDSVKRFLGYGYRHDNLGRLTVDLPNKPIHIVISHVGIESREVNSIIHSELTTRLSEKMSQLFGGASEEGIANGTHLVATSLDNRTKTSQKKKIFVGVDEVQKLKGLIPKLLAFERFLEECPGWRSNVIFIQHGIRRMANDQSHVIRDDSAEEIRALAERINRNYGPVVIYKEHFFSKNSLNINERIALWENADILVCTPYMEGLNLLPLEYLYTRAAFNNPGVLVISEFAQCSALLNGAIRVNPFDVYTMAKMYDYALKLDSAEKKKRMKQDLSFIRGHGSAEWTRHLIGEVNLTPGDEFDRAFVGADVVDFTMGDIAAKLASTTSLVDKFDCTCLEVEALVNTYNSSHLRLIVLDFGGTISKRESDSLYIKRDFLGVSKRKLNDTQKRILKQLSSNPKNIVFIVSGTEIKALDVVFAELFADETVKLGLVANSGLSIRWGHLLEKERNWYNSADVQKRSDSAKNSSASPGWDSVLEGLEDTWEVLLQTTDAREIMENYTRRAAGSHWTETPVSMRWDFRQCDPEWGPKLADQLVEKLKEQLEACNLSHGVEVQRWRNSVQISPKFVSKGTAIEKIVESLNKLNLLHSVDFGLCIGDDVEDESMFKTLCEQFDDVPCTSPPRQLFTVTVGQKTTEALYYLHSPEEVLSLLDQLT